MLCFGHVMIMMMMINMVTDDEKEKMVQDLGV